MVATVSFLLFFVALGLGLFFIALRGGPRGARAALQTQSSRGRRGATALFLALYALLGFIVPAVLLIGNHGSNAKAAGQRLSNMDERGSKLFGQNCGVCHTLAAARTSGQVGPNLDQLRPPKTLVIDALANGRQRGNGTMPANLLTGNDAEAVADYVSRVAGK
jgi:mono/diheme cytochrome c family protein